MPANETEAQGYFERFHPDYTQGLSEGEVSERVHQGLVNGESEVKTKTAGQIISGNLFTPFNLLNAILAAFIIMVGSYKNLLFMGVVISNAFIGAFQELRAKRVIDKLSLIAAPKAHVVRGGAESEIAVSGIVLDDILSLRAGNQICADCIVAQGSCEVDESLLTGESDPVVKNPGDTLFSGSFVVSGSCRAQVEHVGADNYAEKITKGAKYLKKPNSEIMACVNKIIKILGLSIIPVGAALFYKQIFISGQVFDKAVVSTVAALIGMIPEGLVLLTSIVLAVSVIRLSQHKALVQELYAIETLARVDTLCLDKTGTITEGTMQVDGLEPLCSIEEGQVRSILAAMTKELDDGNPTFAALNAYGEDAPDWKCRQKIAFSSARKWSGVSFEQAGSFLVGAGEFILKDGFEPMRARAEEAAAQGQRVLLLAYSGEPFAGAETPEALTPLALLFLSDKIRDTAQDTLRYFAEQGVCLKVISGDSAVTVSSIAKKAGLAGAENYVDAVTLETEEALREAASRYTVFGRVTPQQKLELVKALKAEGHTVAMTGDGVNDVLALKESDCSVAMASGSDAARSVSQLVLLDSNFASMPRIVHEGRRSINNLQRSSSLFLVKSIFSTIMAVCFIFLQANYPFQPIQFTLIGAVTVGIPSFFLALEPNNERIKGRFLTNILLKAIPGALAMVVSVLLLVGLAPLWGFSQEQVSTLAVMVNGFTGFLILFRVCFPFHLVRVVLFSCMAGAFVLCALFLQPLFSLLPLSLPMALALLPLLACATVCMMGFVQLTERIFARVARNH